MNEFSVKSVTLFIESYLTKHNIETYYEFGKYLYDRQFKNKIIGVPLILDSSNVVCRIMQPTNVMPRIVSRCKSDAIEICVDTESTQMTTSNCIKILDKYVRAYSRFVKISSLYLAPAVIQANDAINLMDQSIQPKVRSQKVQELQNYAKQILSIYNM